ncbi:MAG: hypothetical protein H0W13_08770 [Nitrospirales bacterium]|nr:hypothetical protein [Nitrospirales bacterium]
MENETKATMIREWIDPEEGVTVDFDDARDLNAEVTGCNAEVVSLALETPFPHLRQDITIPLGKVDVGEDRAKYTRDPEKSLRHGRLRLTIHQNRPEVV